MNKILNIIFIFSALILLISCAKKSDDYNDSAVIFSDSFTGTSIGSSWTVHNGGGSASISSNQLSMNNGGGSTPAVMYSSSLNESSIGLSVRTTLDTAEVQTLKARAATDSRDADGYLCGFIGSGNLTIYTVSGGGLGTQLAVSSTAITNATTGYIYFFLSGANLSCVFVNASTGVTETVSATDTTFSSGYVGIFGSGTTFDDFSAEVRL